MNGLNLTKESDDHLEEEIKATLEKQYIEEYLQSKGYRREDLRGLPEQEARQLMIEASVYASLKLAYIESKAHFRRKIHWHE
jgi:hypothetical protein